MSNVPTQALWKSNFAVWVDWSFLDILDSLDSVFRLNPAEMHTPDHVNTPSHWLTRRMTRCYTSMSRSSTRAALTPLTSEWRSSDQQTLRTYSQRRPSHEIETWLRPQQALVIYTHSGIITYAFLKGSASVVIVIPKVFRMYCLTRDVISEAASKSYIQYMCSRIN